MFSKLLSSIAILALSGLSQAANVCSPTAVATFAEQEAVFNAFYKTVYVDKEVAKGFSTYVWEGYIEHNPGAPADGRQPASDFLSTIWPSLKFDTHIKIFQAGYGVLHFKETITPPPTDAPWQAVVDIFRLNGTCIAEHWDVVQALPANAANPHPMF